MAGRFRPVKLTDESAQNPAGILKPLRRATASVWSLRGLKAGRKKGATAHHRNPL
jgi:hypothetical protein